MRVFGALLLMILLVSGAVRAGPFDDFPTMPCGRISYFELASLKDASGQEVFTLWLHGYASGVLAAEPTSIDGAVPTLSELGNVISKACEENPKSEISASVLNRLLETID